MNMDHSKMDIILSLKMMIIMVAKKEREKEEERRIKERRTKVRRKYIKR